MDEPVKPGAGAASLSNVVDYAVFESRRQAKLAASGHVVAEAEPPKLVAEGEDGLRGEAPDMASPDDDGPARA